MHERKAMEKKKKDPEAETADMFAVCNRLREVEKCCANCKFVKHEWEGEVSCKHPTLTYVDEYGEPRKADLGIAQYTVCDLWQKQEDAK